MRLFVFGMGYSSRAIAEALRNEAEWIAGTTRSSEKADALKSAGFDAILFDGETDAPGIAPAIQRCTHLLISIAPGEAGDPVLNRYGDLIRRQTALSWIGYLSTVGVYGNHDGAWVDEATPTKPVSRRSLQRDGAEKAWLALGDETGIPTALFRLAGIYGPGRNAFENFKKGTARRIDKPGQVFNRIHVADIGQTVAKAARLNAPGIFNVTDNEPAPPQDVVAYAADLLGVEAPPLVPFAEADLSPMGRSFYGENKRVRNERIKTDLGVDLAFPTYREALKALVPSRDPT
ncbi:MAG: SDR family oxidoreductase [Pseudomonadota bacterium]